MLPRTTQQSHSAAPRREPQIEPWLAMLPPSCLSAPEEDRTNPRCDPEMRGDANNAIEATSELPAGAGCQEKQNLPAKGKVFLLDIPFYRTRRRSKSQGGEGRGNPTRRRSKSQGVGGSWNPTFAR